MSQPWRDIRAHLEAQDDPDLANVLALLTPRDRDAAGPSWFARMVEQARPKWHSDGLCHEYPEVDFFATRATDQDDAVAICGRCLVRDECLDFAVANGEQGVWGGTVDSERRVMRRDQAA